MLSVYVQYADFFSSNEPLGSIWLCVNVDQIKLLEDMKH